MNVYIELANGTLIHRGIEISYSIWDTNDGGARGGFDYNGTEGGGLWFARGESGRLELIDYDGVYELPIPFLEALEAAGFDCRDMIAAMEA